MVDLAGLHQDCWIEDYKVDRPFIPVQRPFLVLQRFYIVGTCAACLACTQFSYWAWPNRALASSSSEPPSIPKHVQCSNQGNISPTLLSTPHELRRNYPRRSLDMSTSRLVRPAFAAARRTAPRTAIRSYATPADSNPKPPVALYGVDGTYANALVRSTFLLLMLGTGVAASERRKGFTEVQSQNARSGYELQTLSVASWSVC